MSCSFFHGKLHFCNFFDSIYRGFDIFFCIKRPYPEPDSPMYFGCSQLFMDKWGAVKTGSAGDIIIHIEKSSHIIRFKSCHVEKANADMVGKVAQAVKNNSFRIFQAIPEHRGEFHFMVVDILKSFFFDPFDSRMKACYANGIQGAVFKPVGIFREVGPCCRTDAGSPCAGEADIDAFFDIKAADPGGAK